MDCCRTCNNKDYHTGVCKKLTEEFKLKSNFDTIVEDGELHDFLTPLVKELVEEKLGEYLKKKIPVGEYNEAVEGIAEDLDAEIYGFIGRKLEVEVEVDNNSEFCCKYYR